MAVRREDLYGPGDALVVDFPVRIARARARRARHSFLARRLVAVAVVLTALGGIVSASAAGRGSEVASRPQAPQSVVVQPGETLWDLSLRYAADGTDPRAYADELMALNDVSGVAPPGTSLELP